MGITIVSDKLKKEEVKRLQKEANELVTKNNYSAHAIQYHFGMYEKLSVSVVCASNNEIILNCNPPVVN